LARLLVKWRLSAEKGNLLVNVNLVLVNQVGAIKFRPFSFLTPLPIIDSIFLALPQIAINNN